MPRRALVAALLLPACGAPEGAAVPEDDAAAFVDTAPADTAPDTAPADTAPPADTGVDTAPADTAPADTGEPPVEAPTAAACLADLWDGATPTVDYDQFAPTIGTHCKGTDHQEIDGVERVVFVGDSITVGTPPTGAHEWFRNVLADELAARFGLEAPAWEWENVDIFDGVVYLQESGDFASCAKWGARTDDLLLDPHRQLETCIPEDRRDARTLVVMTVGGNDVYSLLEDIGAGVDEATLRATYAEAVELVREAAAWVADPTRFPNGAFLVFANIYDFSDAAAAADIGLCPGAGLIGMDAALSEPTFWDIAAEAQEAYMQIAVETGTDLVFLGEAFCGHGYGYTDAAGRCYRGAGAELYLDFTCMHPTAEGHAAIADLVLSVIDE